MISHVGSPFVFTGLIGNNLIPIGPFLLKFAVQLSTTPRRLVMKNNVVKISIEDWRNKIRARFPDLLLAAEVGLSVIFQLAIEDITNPFGLVFVDVPSSGKTITLNFFTKNDLVYSTDSFSAASFVSHAANRTKEDLAKIDLLPKIQHKVFLVRDLSPLFGMRDDDLLKTMGILTRLFDGEGIECDSGLHGQRKYQGDYLFMFLAASTAIQPRVWKVMGNFGSRLFFLNLNIPEKSYEVLAQQLRSKASAKKKETTCRVVTRRFLQEHFPGLRKVVWNTEGEDDDLACEIGRLATLVAHLRGIINVWKDKDSEGSLDFTAAQIEKPDRINQAFYNLARGHARACGRTQISDEDLAIVAAVALSSAQMERVRFFKLLIDQGGSLDTEIIMEALGLSRPTALKLMKVFSLLGIVEISEPLFHAGEHSSTKAKISKKFSWFVGSRFLEIRQLLQSRFSLIKPI